MKNEVTQDLQTKVYFIRRTERLQMVRLVTEKAFSYLWFRGTRINVISFTTIRKIRLSQLQFSRTRFPTHYVQICNN